MSSLIFPIRTLSKIENEEYLVEQLMRPSGILVGKNNPFQSYRYLQLKFVSSSSSDSECNPENDDGTICEENNTRSSMIVECCGVLKVNERRSNSVDVEQQNMSSDYAECADYGIYVSRWFHKIRSSTTNRQQQQKQQKQKQQQQQEQEEEGSGLNSEKVIVTGLSDYSIEPPILDSVYLTLVIDFNSDSDADVDDNVSNNNNSFVGNENKLLNSYKIHEDEQLLGQSISEDESKLLLMNGLLIQRDSYLLISSTIPFLSMVSKNPQQHMRT